MIGICVVFCYMIYKAIVLKRQKPYTLKFKKKAIPLYYFAWEHTYMFHFISF
jgi:hypothetical protein